jgi:hypothetical protein
VPVLLGAPEVFRHIARSGSATCDVHWAELLHAPFATHLSVQNAALFKMEVMAEMDPLVRGPKLYVAT